MLMHKQKEDLSLAIETSWLCFRVCPDRRVTPASPETRVWL